MLARYADRATDRVCLREQRGVGRHVFPADLLRVPEYWILNGGALGHGRVLRGSLDGQTADANDAFVYAEDRAGG